MRQPILVLNQKLNVEYNQVEQEKRCILGFLYNNRHQSSHLDQLPPELCGQTLSIFQSCIASTSYNPTTFQFRNQDLEHQKALGLPSMIGSLYCRAILFTSQSHARSCFILKAMRNPPPTLDLISHPSSAAAQYVPHGSLNSHLQIPNKRILSLIVEQ